jgi:hypothetical protein
MWTGQLRLPTRWMATALICVIVTVGGMIGTICAAPEGANHYTDMVTPYGRADWTAGTVTARGLYHT